MEVFCTSDDRALILHVLQNELGERAKYNYSPEFSFSVGEFTLSRDGRISAPDDPLGVFSVLGEMGLCDFPVEQEPPAPGAIVYPMGEHDGRTLRNLLSIISARQKSINRALGVKGAFYVAPELMNRIVSHPPASRIEFIRALYGRRDDCRGVRFDPMRIVFTGFMNCRIDEAPMHRQLADCIMNAALSRGWVKPYTRNVRNQKYAFRIWLNSVGMVGPEYKDARELLLGRLYGRSDRRSMPRREEK